MEQGRGEKENKTSRKGKKAEIGKK